MKRGERATNEMAARIRAFDWASTDLGCAAAWPAALATIVEVMTAAATPMVLWCGARSLQLYNDAARHALFADRDPPLGAPAADSWGDAWPALADGLTRVRAGEQAVVVHPVVLADYRTWSFDLVGIGDAVLAIGRPRPVLGCHIEDYRDRMRGLFMHAPAPIAILRGPKHIVEVANLAMLEAFEQAESVILGRPAFDVVPWLRERFGPVFDSILASDKAQLIEQVSYRTEPSANGSPRARWANVLFAPLHADDGSVEGILVIADEVTDLVRARDEMARLRSEAEAASHAKDTFLAMLGHELRNPLSPISTALQVMRLRGMTGHELAVLERQVGHLTRLVDDLLDVSRALRGRIELDRHHVELADLVAEALDEVSPMLEQREQEVELDVPAHGLVIDADRARIVQVIVNLLSNAAKYSPRLGRIGIRARRAADRVRLAVRDEGTGITPEILAHVFEPFVQQPQTIARTRGGLGLGLAIVRSLVELHGGTVSATSEGLGRGSEFTIELPVSARVAEGVGEGAGKQPQKRKKILVVDDNEDAATMLGEALEQLGYQVAIAHDGPSALRVAATFSPDVALLDIGLPVMDGFELGQRLREQQPSHQPHLVAVTGYGQDSDRQRSQRAGFERHLVKPVTVGLLSKVVAELVAAA